MSNLTLRQPLLLNGFMATGKSTLGPLVAARANVPFIDLDSTIEAATSKSVARIFSEDGEPAFRNLEATHLAALLDDPSPRVIALGGGTLVNPKLRELALEKARVVTLVARPDTIASRTQAHGRPLLEPGPHLLKRIQQLLATRAQAYANCHTQIRTDDRDPSNIATAILDAWQGTSLLVRATSTYAARITHDAPQTLVELTLALSPSSVFVVTDENVQSLHVEPILSALRTTRVTVGEVIVLTPGEVHKQWPAVQQILEALLASGADRNSLLVAVGGGVVSDIAGFAAAIFLRGIRWVAMPTTLLSMVDAAVGGKTAVDLGLAKNSVGAFHQPSGVIINPAYTLTETNRAYISGLAEVVKCGVIADPALIDLMASDPQRVLAQDLEVVQEMITRSLSVKTSIVSRDERESGERMLLNFGHTIGHALEAIGNFSRLTHGEAITLGMIAILRFGVAQGITSSDAATRIRELLDRLGLPTNLDDEPLEEALTLLGHDKKRVGLSLRLVVLEELGRARIEVVGMEQVRGFFKENTK